MLLSDGRRFDQRHHTAIICPCLDDTDAICNGRIKWYPLERIFEEWLDMIEVGKAIVALPGGDSGDPWKLVPYSETILKKTIEVFDDLVEEIESRLPEDNKKTNTPRNASPLIAESILDTANPRRGFAYRFARKAKRPRFRYVAPGLEIPSASSVAQQPFASLRYDDTSRTTCLPLLLFCATDGASLCMAPERKDNSTRRHGPDSPFGEPYNRIDKYPAGLYLSCTDDTYEDAFEDECKLILPFHIGAEGHARTSDGSRIGENQGDHCGWGCEDRFADLYQPGYLPFSYFHDTRLISILIHWLGMVRGGDWKVGADGVMGGIEEWKKADTEQSWEKYVIPPTW
jgi:hypothetical protein